MSTDSTTTDLYRFYDADERLLYVGISLSAIGRAAQHRSEKNWWCDVARMHVEHLPTRSTAMHAEREAIRSERPIHNVVHNRETTRRRHVANTSPKQMNPWACMYCGRGCGRTQEDAYIQVNSSDLWWVLCRECDDNPNPLYWIDAMRVSDVEAIERWTLHLSEKVWFSWTSWYDLIETHCNILLAKEHAYHAIEVARQRRSGPS